MANWGASFAGGVGTGLSLAQARAATVERQKQEAIKAEIADAATTNRTQDVMSGAEAEQHFLTNYQQQPGGPTAQEALDAYKASAPDAYAAGVQNRKGGYESGPAGGGGLQRTFATQQEAQTATRGANMQAMADVYGKFGQAEDQVKLEGQIQENALRGLQTQNAQIDLHRKNVLSAAEDSYRNTVGKDPAAFLKGQFDTDKVANHWDGQTMDYKTALDGTVTAWRNDSNGNKIEGSEQTASQKQLHDAAFQHYVDLVDPVKSQEIQQHALERQQDQLQIGIKNGFEKETIANAKEHNAALLDNAKSHLAVAQKTLAIAEKQSTPGSPQYDLAKQQVLKAEQENTKTLQWTSDIDTLTKKMASGESPEMVDKFIAAMSLKHTDKMVPMKTGENPDGTPIYSLVSPLTQLGSAYRTKNMGDSVRVAGISMVNANPALLESKNKEFISMGLAPIKPQELRKGGEKQPPAGQSSDVGGENLSLTAGQPSGGGGLSRRSVGTPVSRTAATAVSMADAPRQAMVQGLSDAAIATTVTRQANKEQQDRELRDRLALVNKLTGR